MDDKGKIKIRRKSVYEFEFPDGTLHEITEEQARDMISDLTQLISTPYRLSTFREAAQMNPDSKTVHLESYANSIKANPLPKGFREIGRIATDPKSHRTATFVYGEDDSGNLGFRVMNGRVYPFAKLGKVTDPSSSVGMFLRAFPDKSILLKRDFYNLPQFPQGWMTGRKLKALLDVLVIKGYVKPTKPLLDEKGKIGYFLVDGIRERLGLENNRDLENQVSLTS